MAINAIYYSVGLDGTVFSFNKILNGLKYNFLKIQL